EDSEASSEEAEAVAQGDSEGDSKEDDHDEEAEHEHEVHLAGPMYELGRRFSAIWYAGRAENTEMIHYQLHEIEELVAELDEHSPKENGVDVVDRLEGDVVAPLEKLEEEMEGSDDVDFEGDYDAITENCTSCHADTGHEVIRVTRPEYNPYPNIDMEPAD
ncbi:MAG: hypothetical protein ACOCV2_07030, partial [Persicimonas sp.]